MLGNKAGEIHILNILIRKKLRLRVKFILHVTLYME